MTAPHPSPAPVLLVNDLALRRGERLLFDRVGFSLSVGQLLLVRGPNGAGKSSLLLTLAGILRPESGTIDWPGTEERPLLHLVGHQPGIKTRLTLAENLEFWRRMNGPTGVLASDALEQVGLGGLDGIEAGHLSAGQTKRLALARLLISRRTIWLLDEPTASLDADGDVLVAGLIGAHLATGGAVIAATHDGIAVGGKSATLTLGGSA